MAASPLSPAWYRLRDALREYWPVEVSTTTVGPAKVLTAVPTHLVAVSAAVGVGAS